MCFINPKFKRRFTLEVCTAHGEREEFYKAVNDELIKLLELEIELNKKGNLRWKIEEV